MNSVSYKNVDLKSGFLYDKQQLNKNVTIDTVYKRFKETGRIDAFKCDWKEGMENKPHVFWDSDVAKWMEGAAYILQKKENAELEEKVESIIDDIEKNQHDDGYFNIYFTVCEPDKRYTDRDMHELYCAGHLFEAAVAYYEATGKDRFLKMMEKYADYIYKVFVEDKSASFTTPGHEEIELALVRMYRTTGKKKYLELAAFFINNRGLTEEHSKGTVCVQFKNTNTQVHLPIREQVTAEGHSVRACYLYSALADFAYETDDKELYNNCKAIFEDIVTKKMYITGGIGSNRFGEAFSIPYDLKNERAYAETCAAISLMFFAQRMMQFENDAKYAELIERILYNGMISGLSLSGDAFFYENPLEINLANHEIDGQQYGITTRAKVFWCSCCPPNLNRVLASIGDYVYGYENRTVFVNQFVGSEAVIGDMRITQDANYPKSNVIKIKTENVEKLCVRIPAWCDAFEVNAVYEKENGYAVISNPDKEIVITFEMAPFLVQSNAEVSENGGKIAVCFGPYVCAAEAVDNIENLHSIYIDKNLSADVEYSDDMCGYTLKVKAYRKLTGDSLYSRYSEDFEDYTLKMIPYASFANRGDSNMLVWFNVK